MRLVFILSVVLLLAVQLPHTLARVCNGATEPTRASCLEHRQAGCANSGDYTVLDINGNPISAYCDMVHDGGGWTAFYAGQTGPGTKPGDFLIPSSFTCSDPQYNCIFHPPTDLVVGVDEVAFSSCSGKMLKFVLSSAVNSWLVTGDTGGWMTIGSTLVDIGDTPITFLSNYQSIYQDHTGWIFSETQASGTPDTIFADNWSGGGGWWGCDGATPSPSNPSDDVRIYYRRVTDCTLSAPPNGNLGNCSSTMNAGDPACSFVCDSGYELSSSVMHCSYPGIMLPEPQYCVQTYCNVTAPANGNLGTCESVQAKGTNCTFGCADGYHLSSTAPMTCSLAALTNVSICLWNIPCTMNPPLFGTGCTSFEDQSSCSITCNDNYTLVGSTMTCQQAVISPALQYCFPNDYLPRNDGLVVSLDAMNYTSGNCYYPEGNGGTPATQSTPWPETTGHLASVIFPADGGAYWRDVEQRCWIELHGTSYNTPDPLTIPDDGNAARTYVVVAWNVQNFGCPIVQAAGFEFVGSHVGGQSDTTTIYYGGQTISNTNSWGVTYSVPSVYVVTYQSGVLTMYQNGQTMGSASGVPIGFTDVSYNSADTLKFGCTTGSQTIRLLAFKLYQRALNPTEVKIVGMFYEPRIHTAQLSPTSADATCDVFLPSQGAYGNCSAVISSGTNCTLACSTGSTPVGSNWQYCHYGVLLGSLPSCEPSPCALTAPTNGSLGTCQASQPSGVDCYFWCKDGFQPSSVSPVTCSLGVASNLTTCLPASCVLTPPANGVYGSCSSSQPSGVNCTFACISGYHLNTSAMVTCDHGVASNSNWSSICEPDSCVLTAPANGTLGSCNSTLASGSNCSFACETHYHLSFSDPVSCYAGNASQVSRCSPDPYCALYPPLHGDLGSCFRDQPTGTNCTFHCDPGYHLSTLNNVTCHNKTATNDDTTCEPDSCTLTAPANGNLGNCPSLLTSGSACNFACDADFHANTTIGILCTAGVALNVPSCVQCEPDQFWNGGTCASCHSIRGNTCISYRQMGCRVDGVYLGTTHSMYCDMTHDGGGWTSFYAGENNYDHAGDPSCPDPATNCLRSPLRGLRPGIDEIAISSCAGKMVKLKPDAEIENLLFGAGTNGWHNVSVTSIGASIQYLPTRFFTGNASFGFLITDNTNHTFATSLPNTAFYNCDGIPDSQNGTDGLWNSSTIIRFYYRLNSSDMTHFNCFGGNQFDDPDNGAVGDCALVYSGVSCNFSCNAGYIVTGPSLTCGTDGSFIGDPQTCQACETGKYQSDSLATTCVSCAAGKYSSSEAATICSNCGVGKVQPNPGLSLCWDCGFGYYQNATGNTICLTCAPGTISTITGASICELCDIGKYQDQPGQRQCIACPDGTYQNNTGATSCLSCPNATQLVGMQCVPCQLLGTATPCWNGTQCTVCPTSSSSSSSSSSSTGSSNLRSSSSSSTGSNPRSSSSSSTGSSSYSSSSCSTSLSNHSSSSSSSSTGSVFIPETIAANVTLHSTADITIATTPQWQSGFILVVATAAGVNDSRVVITSITPGGVNIQFQILPDPSEGVVQTTDALDNFISAIREPSNPIWQSEIFQGVDVATVKFVTYVFGHTCSGISLAPQTTGICSMPVQNPCAPPNADATKVSHSLWQYISESETNATYNSCVNRSAAVPMDLWTSATSSFWVLQNPLHPGSAVTSLSASYSYAVWLFLPAIHHSQTLVVSSSDLAEGNIQYMLLRWSTSAAPNLIVGHQFEPSSTVSESLAQSIYEPSLQTDIIYTTIIPLETWVHLAVTYDQTTTALSLYRNGVLVTSLTSTYLSWNGTATNTALGGAYHSRLRAAGSYSTERFSGLLADFVLYNGAATASQILDLYQKPEF